MKEKAFDKQKFEKQRMDKPLELETLSRAQRTERLHHQLGLMYDRAFLSGDWRGDYGHDKTAEPLRTNIFESRRFSDPEALTERLREFLQDADGTVPKRVDPDMLETRTGERTVNRKLFLNVIATIVAILGHTAERIEPPQELELERVVDENIHYFRDMPETVQRGGMPDSARDEENTADGLMNILEQIRPIEYTLTRQSESHT